MTEVRVSDQDPEMAALKALGAALGPLDTTARTRLLDWARDKYVTEEGRRMSEEAMKGMGAQLDALESHAKRLGVSPRDLVHAYSALREGKIAPVKVRDSEEAAAEVREAEQALLNARSEGTS